MHLLPRFHSCACFALAFLAVALALPAVHAHNATLHIDFSSGGSEAPGAAFDADGNLYVSQQGTGVFKVTPAGNASLFSSAVAYPRQILFHDGALYVADYGQKIYKITTSGTATVHATVPLASGANGLNGLAVDDEGNFYASDDTNHTILKIASDGTSSVLVSEAAVNNPRGLAFKSGVLYAADGSNVLAIDPDTGALTTYASVFAIAWGLAFDHAGFLYVSDAGTGTVSRISNNGNTVTAASSGYSFLRAIAFDSADSLYAVELLGKVWRTEAAPTVRSIVRASTNPTTANTVDFTVTFSAPVTGVDASDFVLTTNGLPDASIDSVSADTGKTRTVTVNTGTGARKLRLDLVDDDTIVSTTTPALALGGAGTSGDENGSFSTGETYIVRSADLAVAVADTPDPVNAGAHLTYTITVTNGGSEPAPDASVSLPLPADTTFVSLSAGAGWSGSTPAVGANGTVSVSRASLDAGASGVFTLVVEVAPDTASGTTLSATATASTSDTDADTTNDTATATTTTATSADLGIAISASPEIAPASGTVVYTLTVTNHGPTPVSPAVLATLSGNIALNTVDVPSDWTVYDISETERLFGLSNSSDKLASGESVELTITVDVTSATPGARLALNATVDSFTDDPDATNDEVTLRTIVGPAFTLSTATALTGVTSGTRISGSLYPAGTINAYSFTAQAGDRVFAATASTANSDDLASRDTVLTLLRSDGSTVIEYDDDDGGQSATASSIAGAVIPANGTYYLIVECQRPQRVIFNYDLYVRVQRGTPVAANDGINLQAALPNSGWVSGTTSANAEYHSYPVTLAAGDTVFASLDLDPERDGTGWDALLNLSTSPTDLEHWINGSDLDSDTAPSSEAIMFTAKNAGTYYLTAGTVDDTYGNYRLSTTILPAAVENASTTYSAVIDDGTIPYVGTKTWTLDIPTSQRIGKLKVALNITHGWTRELDIHLTSPSGDTVGLVRNAGSDSNQPFDVILDDDAAYAIAFGSPNDSTINAEPLAYVGAAILKPGRDYRLAWFAGQQAQGTWTLTIRDHDSYAYPGTLDSWSLTVVDEDPLPTGSETTRFSTDFETNDGGFTHSGTDDEWQHGTPAAAPIVTAHSGTKAWKTNLADNYAANSTQDLFSPDIDLSSVPESHPIELSWAMKYQLDDASKDGAYVEVQEVGGANAKRVVWRWLGSAMRDHDVGIDNETIEQSAGWGVHRALISEFRGKTIRIRFHLESDSDDEFAGLAIDDVAVKSYGTTTPPPEPEPSRTVIREQPVSKAVAQGGSVTFGVRATGTSLRYQWQRNGVDLPGATSRTLTIANVHSENVGYYSVIVTGRRGVVLSDSALLELVFTDKVSGSGTEVATDVVHPNGNIYDQILITGPSASTKPNVGQIVRMSFVDLSDDIVQVEFFGAGSLTVTLENPTGPAAPVNYHQPGVTYMKGHATIEITGADASSHLTVFSVGSVTAVNQSLFRDNIAYDGVADIALVTIDSTDGKFGGLRTGNVSYFHDSGYTGVYAPGVDLTTLNIGDLSASDSAIPVLVTGHVDTVRVTGGSLEQANGAPIEVGDVARVQFVDGTTSHGAALPAQPNRATFSRNGTNVTTDLVP